MDFLRATTIEGNYPPARRKTKVNTDSFLKTMGESFLSFFQKTVETSKPSLKESEEHIQEHFRKINEIIDSVDQHISQRMQHHQNEVFSIVKGEIEEMREETQKMVCKLNQAIKDKNTEDQIWQLSNELDYFKSQTYQLFQENKQVRQQMALLNKRIKEYQIELENSDRLMQKLKKKQMKALQTTKHQTVEYQQRKQHLNQEKTEKKLFENTNSKHKLKVKQTGKVVKTEPCEEPEENAEQESLINIKVDSKIKLSKNYTKMITEVEDSDPLQGDWIIPSEAGQEEEHLGISTLPPVNFVQVESSFEKDSFNNSTHKISRGVQTEALDEPKQPSLQKLEVKPLTRVEGVSMTKLKKEKQIDFIKNGFRAVAYNQKNSKLKINMKTPEPEIVSAFPSRKQTRHSRYMSNAFKQGKMDPVVEFGRQEGIRSTMK